jgi:hypothetical protein
VIPFLNEMIIIFMQCYLCMTNHRGCIRGVYSFNPGITCLNPAWGMTVRLNFFILFRSVFWDVLPCKIIVYRLITLMMEAACTSETSVNNYFTQQYILEDKSELHTCRRENWKILHPVLSRQKPCNGSVSHSPL